MFKIMKTTIAGHIRVSLILLSAPLRADVPGLSPGWLAVFYSAASQAAQRQAALTGSQSFSSRLLEAWTTGLSGLMGSDQGNHCFLT
jgi:hypothetical protein